MKSINYNLQEETTSVDIQSVDAKLGLQKRKLNFKDFHKKYKKIKTKEIDDI